MKSIKLETRTFNEFEIQTDLSLDELNNLIDNIQTNQKGKTIHIKAPLELSAEAFLKKILNEQKKVLYFRDISSSTRRLFND